MVGLSGRAVCGWLDRMAAWCMSGCIGWLKLVCVEVVGDRLCVGVNVMGCGCECDGL